MRYVVMSIRDYTTHWSYEVLKQYQTYGKHRHDVFYNTQQLPNNFINYILNYSNLSLLEYYYPINYCQYLRIRFSQLVTGVRCCKTNGLDIGISTRVFINVFKQYFFILTVFNLLCMFIANFYSDRLYSLFYQLVISVY